MRQRIAPVGVEAGRDQDQVRPERFQRRHQSAGEGRAPVFSRRMGNDRGVDDVADAGFGRRARAGIERHLVDGGQEQAVVVFERRLGAVAVVNVEIHHRHPRHPFRLSHARRDGDGGEQAEPHGPIRLGMVARRANGGEGAVHLAPRHGPHRVDRRSRRQTGGRHAAGRKHGVGVQRDHPLHRRRVQQARDIGGRMHPFQIHDLGRGRRPPVAGEPCVGQGVQHRLKTLGTFGMSRAGRVRQHRRMGEDRQLVHGGLVISRMRLAASLSQADVQGDETSPRRSS